jgi:demethylmenaquinone methyltransferase/2-methoxy-6-polyprenyl-1,4-benzoquinol methylase
MGVRWRNEVDVLESESFLREQIAYYKARAHEYDDWWERRGRYDHGDEPTRQWRKETEQVAAALAQFKPKGKVLELASGTGWWTQRLSAYASILTCIDASEETIAVNRARLQAVGASLPTYEVADIFDWQPHSRFDVVFFSFWLSHVPTTRFKRFWDTVAEALNPHGRVFIVDSKPDKHSGARDHSPPGTEGIQQRKLNDGRFYRVVKIYYEPDELTTAIADLGWSMTCRQTRHYFIYGEAIRSQHTGR